MESDISYLFWATLICGSKCDVLNMQCNCPKLQQVLCSFISTLTSNELN